MIEMANDILLALTRIDLVKVDRSFSSIYIEWLWFQTRDGIGRKLQVANVTSCSLSFNRCLWNSPDDCFSSGECSFLKFIPCNSVAPSNSGDSSKCGFSKPCQKSLDLRGGRNSWQRNLLLWCVRELSKKHHPSSDMGRFGDMRSGSRQPRDGSFRNQHVSCFTRIAQVLQWMTVESSFTPLCEPKL